MPISSRDLSSLPSPKDLRAHCEALAVLDLILFPEDWDDRRYSFDAAWGPHAMFQMRDGSGDHMNVLYTKAGGAALRGFAHESVMSPWHSSRRQLDKPSPVPGVFTGLPKELSDIESEPAFGGEEITFCAWWVPLQGWLIGNVTFPVAKDPDGSQSLLACLVATPAQIAKEASDYLEEKVPLAAVKKLFDREPLTDALVKSINPEATLDDVRDEALALGWKIAAPAKKKPTAKKTAKKKSPPPKKTAKKKTAPKKKTVAKKKKPSPKKRSRTSVR